MSCWMVTDTGTGMDEETQAHIFEPFFTTKEKGKGHRAGAGDGLWDREAERRIYLGLQRDWGRELSFKIYLPRVDAKQTQSNTPKPSAELPVGTETVLLSEDEQDVREIAREFLESGGYTVMEAKDGEGGDRVGGANTAGRLICW